MYTPGRTAINVHPANHLIESLKDLVVAWKWKKLTLVYREDRRIVQLARFFEDADAANIEVSLIKVRGLDMCVPLVTVLPKHKSCNGSAQISRVKIRMCKI